jgi:hypothetical protein
VLQARVLDLDGAVCRQEGLLRRVRPDVVPLQAWGPQVRLACLWRTFRAFERQVQELTGSASDSRPWLTFVGSGDFHHVSLTLLRRLRTPCNLLVLDKHPDWVRGVPVLHCGTWLYHAALLPHVHRIFHVGGELDFDNAYRWLAPWGLLRSGKIAVVPAVRRFRGRRWARVPQEPLRRRPDEPAGREQVAACLGPFRKELAARPLYVTLDKDVLSADEAAVNWDSGALVKSEVLELIRAFRGAAGGLAGMDIVGDWSAVRIRGLLRRVFHWTEHPATRVDPTAATALNERLNLDLMLGLGLLDHHDSCGGLRPFAA